MAVNSAELEKGAWYLICHNAYEMMQRFDQKKGKVFKDVLWDGLTEMIGENGIETEKKKLRRQGVDEEYLEDELCARMMPSVLMRGSYKKVLELAKTDPATAQT
ncbi:MAG: hypothetical protein IJ294_00055, partial [Clostridia bacterium]|nr:hypothetical protein [Clostridia bacterium]